MSEYDGIIYQEKMQKMEEIHEFVPVKELGASLLIDGNQYCWLFGDDLQSGISGFGDTPHKAMLDFNNTFYNKALK